MHIQERPALWLGLLAAVLLVGVFWITAIIVARRCINTRSEHVSGIHVELSEDPDVPGQTRYVRFADEHVLTVG
jgi:hypothetical protein